MSRSVSIVLEHSGLDRAVSLVLLLDIVYVVRHFKARSRIATAESSRDAISGLVGDRKV